jgi:hypothetical protein
MDHGVMVDDFNIFNRMNLKTQQRGEFEKECDRSLDEVNTIKNDLLLYIKVSNGILGDKRIKSSSVHVINNYKTKQTMHKKVHYGNTLNLTAKKFEKTGTLLASPSLKCYKQSTLFPTSVEEMRETAREDEKCFQLQTEIKNKLAIHKNGKTQLPPLIKVNTFVRDKSFRATEKSSRTNRTIRSHYTKKSTSMVPDTTDRVFSDSTERKRTTSRSPQTDTQSAQTTEPNEIKVNRILQEFSKTPNNNVKKKLGKIYGEFDGIFNRNRRLSINIERAHDDFVQKMEKINKREEIEQNQYFDPINKPKMFVMDSEIKKDVFNSVKIDKSQVLKDYKLINVLKDDFAHDLMKKYIGGEEDYAMKLKNIRENRKLKNHKRVKEVLDSMQYVKYL